MKAQRYEQVVESSLALPSRSARQQQRPAAQTDSLKHILVIFGLGLFAVSLLVTALWMSVLTILDATQGHPLSSWHHFLAWLDVAKWWALALAVLCVGLPLLWKAYKTFDDHLEEKRQREYERRELEYREREYALRQEDLRIRDLESQRAMQTRMAELAHTHRTRQLELQHIPFGVQGFVDASGRFQALPAVQVEMERALSATRAKMLEEKKAPEQIHTAVRVPDEYDLMSIIRTFPLAEDNIFLGKTGDGQIMTVDAVTQLCHGAFNASTGRGKTIIVRGIEPQLLKVGHEVIHADIKFSLVDEKGNDFRPIARTILAQGDINANGTPLPHLLMREDQICHMVKWLVNTELKQRLALYNRGLSTGRVLYVFLEELAYLVGIYPDLGPLISRLLIVGRSLGVKVFTAAQNFQVQNLKINGGMRENFESAWYLGGDSTSSQSILIFWER